MVYLINGYKDIECKDLKEAERKAEEFVKSQGLSYEKVVEGSSTHYECIYDEKTDRYVDKPFTVKTIVYQYHTLYFETFVITPKFDLYGPVRRERLSKEEKKND